MAGATKVLDYEKTAGTDLLAALLMRADGSFNFEVIQGIMEMRTALASDIARLAARRATEDQVAHLQALTTQMHEHKHDIVQLQDLSIAIWRLAHRQRSKHRPTSSRSNSIEQSYARTKSALTKVLADEYGDVERFEALTQAITERDEEEAAYLGRQIASVGERTIQKVMGIFSMDQDKGEARL